MFNVQSVQREIGGRTMKIETGKVANQADGAVMITYGDTAVLVTACSAPPRFDDIDFFPLTVEYKERQAAAGRFPGGFMKREGRPSQREILTARCIDRPIRPLFPDGYFQEVQIIANVLSADKENDPDTLAIVGASAALSISSMPFEGPLGACRLARIDGEFVINPSPAQLEQCDLNLLLGGRKDEINMIEVAAKQVKEDVVEQAVAKAHEVIGQICDMITELQGKCGAEKKFPISEIPAELMADVRDSASEGIREAKKIAGKLERNAAVSAILDGLIEKHTTTEDGSEPAFTKSLVKRAFDKVEEAVTRKMILEGSRPDGRDYFTVRPLDCQVGILPRTHGSSLFTRGETQALVSVILGTGRDEQIVDNIHGESGQNFMLHYNFPPYSVGEVKPMRSPGRREIGHGALAEKALEAVKPSPEDFPYTIKLISDITGSNGSSSMASVCGGTLALMDAGVPILNPVAGISVGMVSDEDKYVLITDILGEEDHFGDMDFKVAGTVDGITAIQLDLKKKGLPHNILVETLQRTREARMKILEIMSAAIDKPRAELSAYAPKMTSIKIDPEMIGKVIGPGGAMVRSIQEETTSTIEIEEDGTINISCLEGDGHLRAREIIESMTCPPKVGKLYPNARVVSAKDFGVFVEISPGVEGLCHISELADGFIKNVDQVCKVGDVIPVKLIAVDDLGRLKLSRKAALEDLSETKSE